MEWLEKINAAIDYIDIGSSIKTAFRIMSQCLQDLDGYAFDLQERSHREE